MVVSNISFLAQSTTQSLRLKEINTQIADLQRQITTQKKTETFSGLGIDASRVLEMRNDSDKLEMFMKNIDNARIHVEIMADTMEEITEVAQRVFHGIQLQTREGEIDIEALQTTAREALLFINDMLNLEVGGNYLFAGTNTQTQPLSDKVIINTNMQLEVTNWLNGSQSVAAMMTNIQNMTLTDMGYNSTINAAGSISARVDENLEVDYTIMANDPHFQDILKGVAMIANMQYPDPTVDIGTESEFFQLLDESLALLNTGINGVRDDSFSLSSKFSLMQSVYDRHEQDQLTYDKIVGEIEDADTTEALIKLQNIQVQLNASYQATGIINQLSLVNFI